MSAFVCVSLSINLLNIKFDVDCKTTDYVMVGDAKS